MPLTVRKLKETTGLSDADVIQVKGGARYVVRVPEDLSPDAVSFIQGALAEFGLKCLVIAAPLEFFEIVD